MDKENTRGGKRENSGRPSTWNMGKCKVIKVPEAIADKVMTAARRIDEEEYHREYGIEPIDPDQLQKEIREIIDRINQKENGFTPKNAKELIESLKRTIGAM